YWVLAGLSPAPDAPPDLAAAFARGATLNVVAPKDERAQAALVAGDFVGAAALDAHDVVADARRAQALVHRLTERLARASEEEPAVVRRRATRIRGVLAAAGGVVLAW